MSIRKLATVVILGVLSGMTQVYAQSATGTLAQSPTLLAPSGPHQLGPNGLVVSPNWSGYVVTGTGFTLAKGSWIVPPVDCTITPNAYSAFWVGIDGWTSGTVEQTGTSSDCVGGNPVYYAWYEFFPLPPVTIGKIPVAPGDRIRAKVYFNGTKFGITIKNETTGASFGKSAFVSGAERTSAEWIAEAPSGMGGILPLADFGTVFFGEDFTNLNCTNFARDAQTFGRISAFGNAVQQVQMAKGGVIEATPSALTPDGTSFSVAWQAP